MICFTLKTEAGYSGRNQESGESGRDDQKGLFARVRAAPKGLNIHKKPVPCSPEGAKSQ